MIKILVSYLNSRLFSLFLISCAMRQIIIIFRTEIIMFRNRRWAHHGHPFGEKNDEGQILDGDFCEDIFGLLVQPYRFCGIFGIFLLLFFFLPLSTTKCDHKDQG
jgi:hypothetical protein